MNPLGLKFVHHSPQDGFLYDRANMELMVAVYQINSGE